MTSDENVFSGKKKVVETARSQWIASGQTVPYVPVPIYMCGYSEAEIEALLTKLHIC